MPDSDGYPTEEELQRIERWPPEDPEGWFAFVHSCWWAPDWGWREFDGTGDFGRPVRVYRISTGGWSGNESIMEAMQKNWILMMQTWVEHRRGGHYLFMREQDDEPRITQRAPRP